MEQNTEIKSSTFISFLGASDYLPCNYQSPGDHQETCLTPYVQEALVRLVMKPIQETDTILVFLTRDARSRNWEHGSSGKGLEKRLNELKKEYSFHMEGIDIPDIRDEDGIWEVFNIVANAIPENTCLILDITHAFRFLPMLGVILLNYLRFTKGIQTGGIFYGAFEKLGNPRQLETMPLDARLVPIIDLTPFDYIMRFSNAADDFVNFGTSGPLSGILMETATPALRNSRGADTQARALRNLSQKLDIVSLSLATNRGLAIYEGKIFEGLREAIGQVKEHEPERLLEALLPVLRRVENKISGFKKDDIRNGLEAARWCLEHRLIQQGITILQETMVTLAGARAGVPHDQRTWRLFTAGAIRLKGERGTGTEYKELREDLRQNAEELDREKALSLWNSLDQPDFKDFFRVYMMLTEYRNFINHGGTLADDRIQPEEFTRKLDEALERVSDIV